MGDSKLPSEARENVEDKMVHTKFKHTNTKLGVWVWFNWSKGNHILGDKPA